MVILVVKAALSVAVASGALLFGTQFLVKRRYPGTSGGIGLFFIYVAATVVLMVAVPIAVVSTGHFWPYVGGAAVLLAIGAFITNS